MLSAANDGVIHVWGSGGGVHDTIQVDILIN